MANNHLAQSLREEDEEVVDSQSRATKQFMQRNHGLEGEREQGTKRVRDREWKEKIKERKQIAEVSGCKVAKEKDNKKKECERKKKRKKRE